MNVKISLTFAALILLFTLFIIIGLISGAVPLTIHELEAILSGEASESATMIFWHLRFPRVLAAIAVGGALALAGVVMQSVFSNPLVEPYTLGLSGSASLGIAFSYLFSLPQILGAWVLPAGAFIGALPILIFLLHTGAKVRYDSKTILLSGVMLSYICSSLVTLILTVVDLETMGSIIQWGFGSVAAAPLDHAVALLLASVTAGIVLLFMSLQLNALSLGESDALSLGISVSRLRTILLIIATFLTAGAVSVGGVIGFVGLLVPHIIRMLVTSDNRFLIPLSWITGAALLLGADTFGRLIILPREIPVGVITGIIGGGVFLFIIQNRRNSYEV